MKKKKKQLDSLAALNNVTNELSESNKMTTTRHHDERKEGEVGKRSDDIE